MTFTLAEIRAARDTDDEILARVIERLRTTNAIEALAALARLSPSERALLAARERDALAHGRISPASALPRPVAPLAAIRLPDAPSTPPIVQKAV